MKGGEASVQQPTLCSCCSPPHPVPVAVQKEQETVPLCQGHTQASPVLGSPCCLLTTTSHGALPDTSRGTRYIHQQRPAAQQSFQEPDQHSHSHHLPISDPNSGSAMRVLKVVKAGSSGKGTALKDVSDVDLVVFVSSITDFRDLKAKRKKIIAEIQTRLEECRESLGKDLELSIKKTKWENPRVLTFTLKSNTMGEHIDFDVLPAFDALGQLHRGDKPDPQVYIRLTESDPEGSEFSPCFTELQRNFVIDLPTKLKSLIRLVKRWYKQYVLPHKKKLGGKESLPPQYALELLSVYAWERGSRDPAFNMAEGFRTVLELIRQHAKLCVFWTINYGFANETLGSYLESQLWKSRPIILDPADPTGIVGQGSRWDLVEQEAELCCAQQCCWKRNGSAVQPWNVPLQQTRIAAESDFVLHSQTTDEEYPITENRMFATGGHAAPAMRPAQAAEQESYCTLL